MHRTPFVFTGSGTIMDPETNKVTFLAERDRIVAALWRDPSAMLNNPLITGVGDEYYIANRRTLPAKHTPVKVYLKPAPKDWSVKLLEGYDDAGDGVDIPPPPANAPATGEDAPPQDGEGQGG